jgi:hypothetical protein
MEIGDRFRCKLPKVRVAAAGGRVTYRLALDCSEKATRLAVLDSALSLTMYRDTNQESSTKYVWWFFKIQPVHFRCCGCRCGVGNAVILGECPICGGELETQSLASDAPYWESEDEFQARISRGQRTWGDEAVGKARYLQ